MLNSECFSQTDFPDFLASMPPIRQAPVERRIPCCNSVLERFFASISNLVTGLARAFRFPPEFQSEWPKCNE